MFIVITIINILSYFQYVPDIIQDTRVNKTTLRRLVKRRKQALNK